MIRLHAHTLQTCQSQQCSTPRIRQSQHSHSVCATIIIKSLNYDPLAKRVHQHFRNGHLLSYTIFTCANAIICIPSQHSSDYKEIQFGISNIMWFYLKFNGCCSLCNRSYQLSSSLCFNPLIRVKYSVPILQYFYNSICKYKYIISVLI